MAKNFQKAERNIKIDGEYKLLSYESSSESVEMTDGTDLQTKMNSVDKSISDETIRAKGVESTLTTNLNSEISRAKSAESTLTTNLNSEITRAQNAENTLSTNKLDKTTVATSSTLGLVKSGTDITVDTSGNVSVNDNSHKHTVSNISDLTATASELNVLDGITATTQELNYVDGVTSNIQTQLNSKSANGHTHDDRYYTEPEIDTTVSDINDSISSHTNNTSNPHSVTKEQVGLGNVDNKSSATIRGEITKSNVTTALGYIPLNQSLKGSASGLAELDANGKVPSSQLPSYVDDVLEYSAKSSFPSTGETGKIYVDTSTNLTYRWSGSAYVEISPSLALGETSSTAYRGDRGKTAYDHSQSTHARTDATNVAKSSTNGNIKINGTETTVYTHPSGTNPHGTTKSDVGLGNVDNTSDANKPISTAQKAEFDTINSNLDSLGYGDESGNSNLLNLNKCSFNKNNISISLEDNEITVNGSYYSNLLFDKLLDAGSYSISFEVKSSTSSYKVIRVLYEDNTYSDEIYRAKNIVAEKKLKGLMLYSSGNADVGTAVFKNIQIEKGTTATPYKPYIPSVKMLAEEVNTQNESLEGQGLLNKFDGELLQGAYVSSNGSYDSTITTSVCIKNKIDVVAGDRISAMCNNKVVLYTNFRFYKTDGTFISGSNVTNGLSVVVPANATKFSINFATESEAITPSTVGNISIYINNSIDSLKNDLSAHDTDSVKHITATERTNWNAAKTHADSAHAPSNAQANVIETVKVNGTALTPSSKAVNITVPSVGNGTVTIKQAGTSKGTFTMNQTGNTTIELTDNNTTYGVATSSALGLVKSGTDITVDSSGNVSVNDDSHNHVISNVDGLQSALDGKLSKTTYEYNKELALGSSGKVCIGVFPCYDSNISVEIKSTTNITYNGTLVIATQNINTSLGGVYSATVYGDEDNTLTSAIKIQYLSGSNAFSVYINLPSWSKNILHIQCVSLAGAPSSIATVVDSIPSTATIVPTNAFTHTHSSVSDISTGSGTTFAYSKTGLNYGDYSYLAGWNGYELRAVSKSQFASSGHTHSAYVNQNAFSNITVGSTTVSADSATDTLTLVAGSNVTITPDATNDKITIAATNTVTTATTTGSGNAVTAITASNGALTVTKGSTFLTAHQDISGKMNKANPTGTGSFSLNRKSGSTVGDYSFAEGYNTTASEHCSHAEGYGTIASGSRSHAEGYHTTASAGYSHAEGGNTIASGGYSHVEGNNTIASGITSHAEGNNTIASGGTSHAEGNNTIAGGTYQHVQGKFNVEDTTSAFIIGNGTSSSARSNAMTVDWNGNVKIAGDITNGSGVSLNSLNSNITWKRTDDYMIAYNGAINELLAIVWIQFEESGSNIVWSISIPKLAIDSTQRWYVSGHTLNNSTDFSGVGLLISNTGFHGYQANTQNIARAFHINWYYR